MAVSIGNGAGLLITFDQDADYGSPNFLWFRERLERFVYVDRIVVDGAARGRGYARQLYEALFETSRAAGHDLVTCEVNLDPPNPGSDVFHARMGFEVVGQAELAGKGIASGPSQTSASFASHVTPPSSHRPQRRSASGTHVFP